MKFLQIAILLVLMVSCSAEETPEEPSVIDEAVQKTADAAVGYIKDPLEKAEAVKASEEARRKKIEEQTQ